MKRNVMTRARVHEEELLLREMLGGVSQAPRRLRSDQFFEQLVGAHSISPSWLQEPRRARVGELEAARAPRPAAWRPRRAHKPFSTSSASHKTGC